MILIIGEKTVKGVFKAPMAAQVQMETSKGTIVIELDREKAPVTTDNFLRYVNDGFYDGQDGAGATLFHRVIKGFMIQCGGFTEKNVQKGTRAPIANEASNGLKNLRGTLAMARTSDPNSATAQFFINLVDNTHLDYVAGQNPGYAVFGKVIQGMDVVDAIAAVRTKSLGSLRDYPVEPIVITSAKAVAGQ